MQFQENSFFFDDVFPHVYYIISSDLLSYRPPNHQIFPAYSWNLKPLHEGVVFLVRVKAMVEIKVSH